MKLARIVFYSLAFALLLTSGCVVGDVGGILVSPGSNEKKVPAEFALGENVDEENLVLILVDGGPMSKASITFQNSLALTVSGYLQSQAKMKGEHIMANARPLLMQTAMPQIAMMSPAQIGEAVGAKWVLNVIIEDYKLYQMGGQSYYSGSLVTRSFLYDCQSKKAVWPINTDGKYIANKVELEAKGPQETMNRLKSAAGYCITRCLYDCPEDRYKVADEVKYNNERYW